MKLCDTCIYRNENEYHQPCIVYRDDCKFYEREGDMTREEREEAIENLKCLLESNYVDSFEDAENEALRMAIVALEQEQNIKAMGEDMRICREAITDEKVLIGFNMAVAICNKYLGEEV